MVKKIATILIVPAFALLAFFGAQPVGVSQNLHQVTDAFPEFAQRQFKATEDPSLRTVPVREMPAEVAVLTR